MSLLCSLILSSTLRQFRKRRKNEREKLKMCAIASPPVFCRSFHFAVRRLRVACAAVQPEQPDFVSSCVSCFVCGLLLALWMREMCRRNVCVCNVPWDMGVCVCAPDFWPSSEMNAVSDKGIPVDRWTRKPMYRRIGVCTLHTHNIIQPALIDAAFTHSTWRSLFSFLIMRNLFPFGKRDIRESTAQHTHGFYYIQRIATDFFFNEVALHRMHRVVVVNQSRNFAVKYLEKNRA